MGRVCIEGKAAGREQDCGGRDASGLCRRRWGDPPAQREEQWEVSWIQGSRSSGAAPGALGASLPLYTALAFPQLLVLPPSSPYLPIRHREAHG